MRDGTRIATDVYRPKDTSKKYATIFVRTPYNFNFWDVRNGVRTKMVAYFFDVSPSRYTSVAIGVPSRIRNHQFLVRRSRWSISSFWTRYPLGSILGSERAPLQISGTTYRGV